MNNENNNNQQQQFQRTTISISPSKYKKIAQTMTAQEAGEWAIKMCQKNNWEVTETNILSALSNLEMDL